MDKYYETSLEWVIASIPFLARCHEFRIEKQNIIGIMIYPSRGGHCIAGWLLDFFTTFTTIFLPCTNFRECSGLNIWHGFVFANEKDDKICKIGKFHTHKNTVTWEKE